VSFSDQLQVVPTEVYLTPKDEDYLWWTEDELELIVITAKVKGDLDAFREGLIKAQFHVQDVLKEQDRLRQMGQLGSDWRPIARVSRKSSSGASRIARRNGMEIENIALQDYDKLDQNTSTATSSRNTNFARVLRSRLWSKVRPVDLK